MIKMIHESKYGNIYYELSGVEGASVIAFCHGVGMDHQTFKKQIDALESDYQVLVWDMPGHGRSSIKNKEMNYSLMAAECLVELLDITNTKRAILGGLSLGSFVVQYVLEQHPERVISTFHIGGIPLYPKYSSIIKPIVYFTGLLKLMPSNMFYRSFAKHRANQKETQRYLQDSISKVGKDLVLKITKDMGENMIRGTAKPPNRPLLIACGEDDIYTRSYSVKWHKRIPESNIAIISNANHIANQDNWKEFNESLIMFLEKE
jgi:3-oxoadipate enol-lactonase